jgi:hypothetical protein
MTKKKAYQTLDQYGHKNSFAPVKIQTIDFPDNHRNEEILLFNQTSTALLDMDDIN